MAGGSGFVLAKELDGVLPFGFVVGRLGERQRRTKGGELLHRP